MLFQKFDEDTGILYVNARGNIDFFEVIEFHNSVQKNKSLPRRLKILTDTRQSKFDFEIKYYDAISQVIGKLIKKYDIIKEAIITDPPYNSEIAFMFDDKTIYENYSFKVFTSEEAALKWLNF